MKHRTTHEAAALTDGQFPYLRFKCIFPFTLVTKKKTRGTSSFTSATFPFIHPLKPPQPIGGKKNARSLTRQTLLRWGNKITKILGKFPKTSTLTAHWVPMVLLPIRSNLINFVISHFFQSAADFLFCFSNQENQSTGSKNESKFYITQFFFNSQGNSIFFLLSKKMRKTDKKCAINRGTIFSIS